MAMADDPEHAADGGSRYGHVNASRLTAEIRPVAAIGGDQRQDQVTVGRIAGRHDRPKSRLPGDGGGGTGRAVDPDEVPGAFAGFEQGHDQVPGAGVRRSGPGHADRGGGRIALGIHPEGIDRPLRQRRGVLVNPEVRRSPPSAGLLTAVPVTSKVRRVDGARCTTARSRAGT